MVMKRWYFRHLDLVPSLGIVVSFLALVPAGQLWARGTPSFVFALVPLPFLISIAILLWSIRKERKDVEARAKAQYKARYGTDP
jgi:hypothetical protein